MDLNKRVSVKDVARAANVSVGTVSNYLNGTKVVSPRTRSQIEAAIAGLGYRRNQVASSLRTSRTLALGLIVPSIANPFYTSVFEGAEIEARRRGYTLALGVTHYEDAIMLQYLENFRARQMDGIIINGYNTFYGPEALKGFAGPVLVIEPPADARGVSTIAIDNFAAGYEATRHLLDKGHRRIAIVPSSPADARYAGYLEALKEMGIAPDPMLVSFYGGGRALAAQAEDQQGLIKQGEAVMHSLLDRTDFTACFFTLDIFAVGALKALRERGVAVPGEMALVGFDDIPIAAFLSPALTTIAQPHHEMGASAVAMLVSQLQGDAPGEPVHLFLGHRLMTRQSA